MKLRQRVYEEVKKIAKGEVKSYKDIAKETKTSPRMVGRILSENERPIEIPCHRVVRSDGRIGDYTFKGRRMNKMKEEILRKEGVKMRNKRIIRNHKDNGKIELIKTKKVDQKD